MAAAPRNACFDTEMSEIFRSAYLRALAFMADTNQLPFKYAVQFATAACPIDIELMRVVPLSRPNWWPRSDNSPIKSIDTSFASIWQQVESLWILQKDEMSFLPDIEIGSNQMLIAGSGLVGDGESVYDLEICGAFQKSDGPMQPSASCHFGWQRNSQFEWQ